MELTDFNRNRVYTYQAACHLIVHLASQIEGEVESVLKNLISDMYQSCISNLGADKKDLGHLDA